MFHWGVQRQDTVDHPTNDRIPDNLAVFFPADTRIVSRPMAETHAPESRRDDQGWMSSLVLAARSAHVWLDQLSKRHQRPITRLDEISDRELDELAAAGFTGLWLIGVWERSAASRRIKQVRGDTNAASSAYALADYTIAVDLGGTPSLADLADRAAARGILLAADMVPNHLGIDSPWVAEHPDWFLSVGEPPYRSYRFTGPDLSSDDRMVIQLEDHYWDQTDAAVVFKRTDPASGEVRYIYHGNDGTDMPWNDTAQLDHLRPDVREQIIRTILEVARHFPIIRFDAAMTLVSEHMQRLWHPAPGAKGSIPSRAEHSLSPDEFATQMPGEFWADVVARVAEEAPGTLLLAEAYWLMEGYFVRSLGMHRVYNSAFMHMSASEDNAGLRAWISDVSASHPETLDRFVNFMSNPDEEPAAIRFGTGDKYFGVCTLMVTLPGLPMFSHGQVEGLCEQYGMEFLQARLDEVPDRDLVERHRRQLLPLLARREDFAGVAGFRLFDVLREGAVVEDVFAFSNVVGGRRSLVLYNNRDGVAEGRLHWSAPFATKDGGEATLERTSLVDALGFSSDADAVIVARDCITDRTHTWRAPDLARHGLAVSLGPYEAWVLVDFEERLGPDGLH